MQLYHLVTQTGSGLIDFVDKEEDGDHQHRVDRASRQLRPEPGPEVDRVSSKETRCT
jgi:hypothetical protein